MNVKNEIKSIIVRSGMTMQQVVDLLSQMGTPKSRRLFGERRSNGACKLFVARRKRTEHSL